MINKIVNQLVSQEIKAGAGSSGGNKISHLTQWHFPAALPQHPGQSKGQKKCAVCSEEEKLATGKN